MKTILTSITLIIIGLTTFLQTGIAGTDLQPIAGTDLQSVPLELRYRANLSRGVENIKIPHDKIVRQQA